MNFFPLSSLKRGLLVQPGSQDVRIWQSLPHAQGVRVSSDPVISPQLSLLAHPLTQLSPQFKFLPLKWGWVFDLPSEEDLSSQGCPGVWTGLGGDLSSVSSARRAPRGSCQGQLSRASWKSSLQSRLQNPGAPSKGCVFSYLSSKAGGSEGKPGL